MSRERGDDMSDSLNEIIFYLGYIKGKLSVIPYKDKKVIEKLNEAYEEILKLQIGADKIG